MNDEQKALVDELIKLRWTYNRHRYNSLFTSFGPGAEWERWKVSKEGVEILRQDQLLSPLVEGKEPLKG
jgi:hypothetical protein